MKLLSWWLFALCSTAVYLPARAAVTATDLQVAGRALSFMESPLTGVVRVGILYAVNSPRSQRQAEELNGLLAGGLKAGNVVLQPVLIEVGNSAAAQVDMFFLTEYVSAEQALAAIIGSSKKRPCITTDIAQVQNGACLMGVRSQPNVEIVVNRAAAKSSGVAFATVFRVMITEI